MRDEGERGLDAGERQGQPTGHNVSLWGVKIGVDGGHGLDHGSHGQSAQKEDAVAEAGKVVHVPNGFGPEEEAAAPTRTR